jgi:hypothetical protein
MSSTPAVSPSVTPTLTPSVSTSPPPSTYTIDWSFSQLAQSGEFSINVDSVPVVYATSSNSGQITVSPGAYIITSVSAGASSGLIADAGLTVNDNGTTVYNNNTQGSPFAGETYSYNATGNGSIAGTAYSF